MVQRVFTLLDEEQALHWIGAAVVTLWATVPFEVQESIVQRAIAMADGDVGARTQIEEFLKGMRRPP